MSIKKNKKDEDSVWNTDPKVRQLKDCNVNQMIYLITDICENQKPKQLKDKKEYFIQYFKDNKIKGGAFIEINRKKFGDEIVKYQNNKLFRGPSLTLYSALKRYDFKQLPSYQNTNKGYTTMTDLNNIDDNDLYAILNDIDTNSNDIHSYLSSV